MSTKRMLALLRYLARCLLQLVLQQYPRRLQRLLVLRVRRRHHAQRLQLGQLRLRDRSRHHAQRLQLDQLLHVQRQRIYQLRLVLRRQHGAQRQRILCAVTSLNPPAGE